MDWKNIFKDVMSGIGENTGNRYCLIIVGRIINWVILFGSAVALSFIIYDVYILLFFWNLSYKNIYTHDQRYDLFVGPTWWLSGSDFRLPMQESCVDPWLGREWRSHMLCGKKKKKKKRIFFAVLLIVIKLKK